MWNKIERVVEWCIFQSRWLQVPVYLGMCIVMGMYSFVFCKFLKSCITKFSYSSYIT